MPDTKFLNPYKGCCYDVDCYKATVRIPRAVFNRIAACRLAQGTMEITFALLIQKLITALDERNITDIADAREYEMLLGHSRLALEPDESEIRANREYYINKAEGKSCSIIEQDSGGKPWDSILQHDASDTPDGPRRTPSRGSTPPRPNPETPLPNVGRGNPRLPSKEPLPSSVNPKPKGSVGGRGRGGGRSRGKTEKGEKE